MKFRAAIAASNLDVAVRYTGFGYDIRIVWKDGKYQIEYWNDTLQQIAGVNKDLTINQLKEEIGINYYAEDWEPYQ